MATSVGATSTATLVDEVMYESQAAPQPWELREIAFPVDHPDAWYGPDWHAPRGGGTREHLGTDIFAPKLTPVVAARSGVIVRGRSDAGGISGNYVVIRDPEGWEYLYIHLNNDTPGSDDQANPPEWILHDGMGIGSKVERGQPIGFLGDSGNAEDTPAHLHFEIRRPRAGAAAVAINAFPSLRTSQGRPIGDQCQWNASPEPTGASSRDVGYHVAYDDGGVFSYGQSEFLGSPGGDLALAAPVVGGATTPSGDGYWLVAADGGVFTYGDAPFHGSAGALDLAQPIVGIAPTPTGDGYWLVAADGGVFTYGEAPFHGSLGATEVSAEIVDIAASPIGGGYWILTDRGGIHPFGEVEWHGSVQSSGLCAARVGRSIVAGADGAGYVILTDDGEVRAFGSARDHGDIRRIGAAAWGRPVAVVSGARPGPGDSPDDES